MDIEKIIEYAKTQGYYRVNIPDNGRAMKCIAQSLKERMNDILPSKGCLFAFW